MTKTGLIIFAIAMLLCFVLFLVLQYYNLKKTEDKYLACLISYILSALSVGCMVLCITAINSILCINKPMTITAHEYKVDSSMVYDDNKLVEKTYKIEYIR